MDVEEVVRPKQNRKYSKCKGYMVVGYCNGCNIMSDCQFQNDESMKKIWVIIDEGVPVMAYNNIRQAKEFMRKHCFSKKGCTIMEETETYFIIKEEYHEFMVRLISCNLDERKQ